MAKKQKPGALFIPAGACLGVGIGLLLGNIAAFTLIGVGVGFLCFAIIEIMKKK